MHLKFFAFLLIFSALILITGQKARAACPDFLVAMKALDEAAPSSVQNWRTRVDICLSEHKSREDGSCMGLVCEAISFRNENLDREARAAYNSGLAKLKEAGLSEANVECYTPQ